jgi:hypothetical protein
MVTGMSQKMFAAYLGLGVDLYHSLELGRVALTKKNAQAIALRTGAIPDSLNHRTSTVALDADNGPYTERSWNEWQNNQSHSQWQRAECVLQWTEFLLSMADKQGNLPEVCFELCDCLTQSRQDFGLRQITDRELTKSKAFMMFTAPFGYLRSHKKVANMVGFKDTDKARDQSTWTGGYHYTPSWSPHAMLPVEVARRFQIFNRELDKLPAAEKKKLFASTLVVEDRTWITLAEQFLQVLMKGVFGDASFLSLRELASTIEANLVKRGLRPKGEEGKKKAEEIVAKIQRAVGALERRQTKPA